MPTLPLSTAAYPLNAQAYTLQQIFHTHVQAHHGRFRFRDDAWKTVLCKEQLLAFPNEGAKNAAKAVSSCFRDADIPVHLEDAPRFASDSYTACAFSYLLYGLHHGTLMGKISAENCARQLGWLSQIPSHAEAIFKYTYDVKWFTKHKALRGTMLFAGEGIGDALADESARLMSGIAACKSICVPEAPSVLLNDESALFMVFVLHQSDFAWALPLLDLARARGLCAAAVTMSSLQNEVLPHTDACLPYLTVEPIAIPVLGIMPMQVFANEIALTKGLRAHSMLQ